MRKTVIVRTSFVGFHAWPNAPEVVAYLRTLHRHVFDVELRVRVEGSDREVEYHMLQVALEQAIGAVYPTTAWLGGVLLEAQSCEHIAEALGAEMIARGYAVRAVEVDEDGENGSLLEWD